MTDCVFCGLQHLKPEHKRINVKTGETKTIKGNLHYIRNEFNELVPCCTFCKEALESLEKVERKGELKEVIV